MLWRHFDYQNWSKGQSFLANVKDWFSNAFEKAKDIVEKFKEKFEQVKEAVQPITSALSEDSSGAWML